MSMKQTDQNSTQLRQEAEEQLAHLPKLKPRPAEELLHELQVHQIELEMQNEQLRKAQVELEKSRDRYVDLYDFAPVGYITLNHEGMIDEINLTGAALLGVERSKLPRRRFASFVATEDRDRWHRHFMNVLTRDDTLTCELPLQHDDGSRFFARLDCLCLKKDGKESVVRIVLADVTARKQAEEALLKAGALQSAIFNSANFSSIATDAKGVIQIFNVGAERMLGYMAADVMNKITPADISDPQEVIARAKALSSELGTPITPGFEALVFKASRGIEDIYELTYIRKDGSRFPAVVSVTALRDAQDTIIGYLLIGTDNTARKQIEVEREKLDQRLRDQQFYTRSLFESNIDAIMTTDPSGIITDVNKQMGVLTGCTRDELIGAPFKNYFTDPERAEASIKQVLSEKKVTDYELTARARDGKETVVSYNATTFYDRERRLQGVFAAARDITERKHLNQMLQEKNAELETANKELEAFSYSVSHDLRTPLRAVDGFSQMLLKNHSGRLDEEGKRLLNVVRDNTKKMGQLIDDILAFTRVGQLEIKTSEVDMEAVAREVWQEIKSSMAEREPSKARRDVQLEIKPLPKVQGDPAMLRQVWTNLLGNAAKFTSSRTTARIEIGGSPGLAANGAGNECTFYVKDNGVGFDQQYVEKLFGVFQRLHGVAEFEGTGIGLVIVKRIINRHGGRVWAEGKSNEGATFYFALPI